MHLGIGKRLVLRNNLYAIGRACPSRLIFEGNQNNLGNTTTSIDPGRADAYLGTRVMKQ